MRGKFLLGAGLLIALLLGCLAIGAGTRQLQTPVLREVRQAQTLVTEAPRQAAKALQNAKQIWKSHWRVLASVSVHDTMDDVDRWFSAAGVYLQSGATDDFLSACRQLETLLESIIQDHKLTWWNLL